MPVVSDALEEGIFDRLRHPKDRRGRWEQTFTHAGETHVLKTVEPRSAAEPGSLIHRNMVPLEQTEAYRRGMLHGTDYLDATTYHGDEFLYDLAHDRDYHGPAHAVSEEELRGVIADGGLEVHRGVSDVSYAGALQSGGYYAGAGFRGHGMYFGHGPHSHRIAAAYALAPPTRGIAAKQDAPVVVHGALDPAARIADYPQLRAEAEREHWQWAQAAKDATTSRARRDAEVRAAVARDLGRYATVKGYDAVKVTDDEVLVLNRTALHVARDVERVRP